MKLNEAAFSHARQLIDGGRVVFDQRDDWSEHQPSAEDENRFIEEHGWHEFAKWFLGIDDTKREETKERYRFPYGDFEQIHRCAVLSAESRAGQYKHHDIENAVAHLHGMIDALART
jgi:hypothetical protein